MHTIKDTKKSIAFPIMVERVLSAGSDFDKGFFLSRFEGGYCLQHNPDELAALLVYLKAWFEESKTIGNYLEIGAAACGFTRIVSENIGMHNCYIIDDGKHPTYEHAPKNLEHVKANKEILIADSHSKETEDWIEDNIKETLDLVFIDGDHTEEGCRQDLEMVLPYCDCETLIILHDTCKFDLGVKDVWNNLDNSRFEKLAHFVNDYHEQHKYFIGIGVARLRF